jgi:hypothetical protein
MKRAMWMFLLILVVMMAVFLVVTQYSWVFRKSVEGEILEVERVLSTTAVISNGIPAQAFSFAVAIRKKDGEIVTASGEDRQWAVAKKGMCVDATVDPYPPWNMDKAGTFYNARLLKLMDCHGQLVTAPDASPDATNATATPAPAEATPAGK